MCIIIYVNLTFSNEVLEANPKAQIQCNILYNKIYCYILCDNCLTMCSYKVLNQSCIKLNKSTTY